MLANAVFRTMLDIKFELMPDAPEVCMPQPVSDIRNLYSLKSKINFSLASGDILAVPTGIRLLNLPDVTINPNTQDVLNMFVEASCISDEHLLVEYGLRVLGPQSIDRCDEDEIKIIIQNANKTIFKAEAGDELGVIQFNLKPYVLMNIDMISQNTPKEMRINHG